MKHLIFCSFEVGGIPYKIAEILNRHGIETAYLSLDPVGKGHDSSKYHYGNNKQQWNLSPDMVPFPRVFDYSHHKNIIRELNKQHCFETCMAFGNMSFILADEGIPYVVFCYGSDIDQNLFKPYIAPNLSAIQILKWKIAFYITTRRWQFKSFRSSQGMIISPYEYPIYRKYFYPKELFFIPHFFQIQDFTYIVESKLNIRKKFCKKFGVKHILFSSVRQFWAGINSLETDHKGNDIILRTIAVLVKKMNKMDFKLILVEKGPDVEASKVLSHELGINDFIHWVSETPRDALEEYYQAATICFGQFGTPAITFAMLEPLCNATPCASWFGDIPIQIPYYSTLPPVLNSKIPEEIAAFVSKMMDSNDECESLGKLSWEWTRMNCSEENFVIAYKSIFGL